MKLNVCSRCGAVAAVRKGCILKWEVYCSNECSVVAWVESNDLRQAKKKWNEENTLKKNRGKRVRWELDYVNIFGRPKVVR